MRDPSTGEVLFDSIDYSGTKPSLWAAAPEPEPKSKPYGLETDLNPQQQVIARSLVVDVADAVIDAVADSVDVRDPVVIDSINDIATDFAGTIVLNDIDAYPLAEEVAAALKDYSKEDIISLAEEMNLDYAKCYSYFLGDPLEGPDVVIRRGVEKLLSSYVDRSSSSIGSDFIGASGGDETIESIKNEVSSDNAQLQWLNDPINQSKLAESVGYTVSCD